MTSKKSLEQRLAELREGSGDGPGFTREQLAEAWREGLRPADEREHEHEHEREGEGDREADNDE